MTLNDKLKLAKGGNINAFNDLFKQYDNQLKSYLYRLLTNREDVEDFYHNTFIKAFDKMGTFKGEAKQFKSWVFSIATNLSFNYITRQKKWQANAQDKCRDNLVNDPNEQKAFIAKVAQSKYNAYEIKEHIDFCFTCINKTLSIEKQVAVLLKDVYDFKVKEVAGIMGKSLGQVKHYLVDVRKEMTDIFEGKCALINKKGTCHQCSELQGIFNPKGNIQRELMKIQMVKDAENMSKKELFTLRTEIVNSIIPTAANGTDLHDHLMQHLKKVNTLS